MQETLIYNVTEMLSTSNRDFLVRSDGEQVKVDSLKGKMVGVYKLQEKDKRHFLNHVLDAYNELIERKDFEIVFLGMVKDNALEHHEEEFNESFSEMPWFAVPFSDFDARSHLAKLFNNSYLTILDAKGQLLLRNADLSFELYGADIYPFTSGRIQEIREEYERFKSNKSLSSLLGSSNRDFVISSHGKKVPISELEGKIVGLYMYGSDLSLPLLPKLVEIYDELEKMGKNFEIVLVNLHFSVNGYGEEESFNENFGKMPWSTLPFKDRRCRDLWRMLAYYADAFPYPGEDGVFVTIGSDGKSIDEYSAKVILEFGLEAYPFTREKAAECEMKRLRTHSIEQLLIYANARVLIQNNGVKIPVSQVFGKNILLFIHGSSFGSIYSSPRTLVAQLIKWQEELSKENQVFEIIFLCIDNDETSFDELLREVPWPAFPFDDAEFLYKLVHDALNFGGMSPKLVAFGPDGHLLTRKALFLLEIHGVAATEFFTEEQLLQEAGDDVASRLIYPVRRKDGRVM